MRVLIIGTLGGYVSTAAKIALSQGAKVAHSETIDEALALLRSGKSADMALVDLELDVKELIEKLQNEHITLPIIACGINVKPKQAAQSIRDGAKEFLPLPPDPHLIAAVIQSVAREESTLIAESSSMRNLQNLADKVAPTQANILITGESGTGKEVMARYIQSHSNRCDKPFICLNCAAIPENLLESELFGHEKGAFTGAIAQRIGRFEESNGGTILLDEISEMHTRLQAKLLRAIQEREIYRLGGSTPISLNIRIIATSNRDLHQAVQNQDFREDLYFRLNVIHLQLPPLRERKEDITLLAKYFVQKYAQINHIQSKSLSLQSLEALNNYSWPGNIRELENTVHRGLLLAQGDFITPSDLRFEHKNIAEAFVGTTVADAEKRLILDTLNRCLGNRTQAASILGISIRTLRNKLKEYEQNKLFHSGAR